MIRGAIVLIGPGSAYGAALAGSPARWIGEGLADIGGRRLSVDPGDISPARLWLARGRDWRGPFRCWRAAVAALAWPPDVVAGLARGRGKPGGASIIARGWRYRLAYGGERPPERYGG